MNKKITFIILFSGLILAKSQNIEMNFPKFSGKSYDFIIFQGDQQKTVYQGVIPDGGKFTLSVPEIYGPYTGMSRWLITGTKEGGGLDMYIPGHDFSVSCTESQPNDKNIIYTNNSGNTELNNVYKVQQGILSRYESMALASRSYDISSPNYSVFKSEKEKLENDYVNFQRDLRQKSDYISRFLNIVNITRGIAGTLSEKEEDRARDISNYITNDLDFKILYTSGHWSEIIRSWVSIHTNVLKDPIGFVKDFKTLTNRIPSPDYYNDFCGRLAYYLSDLGKDDYISLLSPIVTGSGKITDYRGSLSSYIRGTVGSIASPLLLKGYTGDSKKDSLSSDSLPENSSIKTTDLIQGSYNKLLLVFYQSDCGHCDKLLQELSANYKRMTSRGVKILGISSDTDSGIFNSKKESLKWPDLYLEEKGLKGENYKNYGVIGTPTMFLLDKSGQIIYRGASLKELQSTLSK
ncbi:TlpA family protein disulfide reductase [Elizabethkingia anophelis]|nr:TlpA family protein disulfide reductase [Elizabethkingia anophelis]